MIFYLCNGQNPKCKESADCGINQIEGLCFHTPDHCYAMHNPDLTPQDISERFEKQGVNYYERREPWMR